MLLVDTIPIQVTVQSFHLLVTRVFHQILVRNSRCCHRLKGSTTNRAATQLRIGGSQSEVDFRRSLKGWTEQINLVGLLLLVDEIEKNFLPLRRRAIRCEMVKTLASVNALSLRDWDLETVGVDVQREGSHLETRDVALATREPPHQDEEGLDLQIVREIDGVDDVLFRCCCLEHWLMLRCELRPSRFGRHPSC